MQLRKALTAATFVLIGGTALANSHIEEAKSPAVDEPTPVADSMDASPIKRWLFKTALLLYHEVNRVSAVEPAISATRQFSLDKSLTAKVVLDTLSGASHNGASPTDRTQTFTGPSGRGGYSVAAGKIPLDPSFTDQREALNLQWQQNLSSVYKWSLGGNASNERDFLSFGANTEISRDFNEKNTTLAFGISGEADFISPHGGAPTPLTTLAAPVVRPAKVSESEGEFEGEVSQPPKTRQQVGALVGITQVINRRSLIQLNYTRSSSSGYHTDPYKVVSVIDATPGTNLGETLDYIYESRPEQRTRQAIYWIGKYHLKEDIVDLSYRYYWDNWGIRGQTLETHYRWFFDHGWRYVEPHLRYYRQTAADFYRTSLLSTDPLPQFISGDYRLGDMHTITVGLKYGRDFKNGKSFSVRGEYYLQAGRPSPGAVGIQLSQNLFPAVKAFMAQLIYSY